MTFHSTRLRRSSAVFAAAAVLTLSGGLTGTASAVDVTSSCGGVMEGSGDSGTLTKSLVSISPGETSGDYTIVYEVTSTRPAGTYRLRDCAFIDTGAAGSYDGEQFIGSTDEHAQAFTANTSGGSTATFSQNFTGIAPGDSVCDRAAMSGTDANGVGFTDKSNVLCVTPSNPPVVPEATFAVTLPFAAAGAVALLVLYRRRRSASPATVA